ncbi:hypothetical protein JAAARDRAFT_187670 [Jaapia argillacea MUCL 33604]|uniref:Uncharacterized protein n=1 Tax=Jaapia argillacea MUCL 33604 TaxID=933084 RepID=A0A067QNV8_9AGAM|nr:hypothetical protein JAAARDRAFT_187670 [Jaapia argillacea MUCL 33604]
MSLIVDALVFVTVGTVIDLAWTGLDSAQQHRLAAPQVQVVQPPIDHRDAATWTGPMVSTASQACQAGGSLLTNPILGSWGSSHHVHSVYTSPQDKTQASVHPDTPQLPTVPILASQDGPQRMKLNSSLGLPPPNASNIANSHHTIFSTSTIPFGLGCMDPPPIFSSIVVELASMQVKGPCQPSDGCN